MARAGLKHWMLHNDQLAHELDETLKLSPGYDPVRDVDPALTFHAPLLTGPDSIPGDIRAVIERNSEATYKAPRGAFLLSASDDESRHEYTPDDQPLGVLMESANTNKCTNYNANPDAALSNITQIGDPAAIFSRVQDVEELAAAGLTAVCKSGFVLKLDNSAGSSGAEIQFQGATGNLNDHVIIAYARIDPASTGAVEVKPTGQSGIDVTGIKYERIVVPFTPTETSRAAAFNCQAGGIGYVILNQLEESPVPTSIIVTEGAATSRAVDQLSWPLAGGPKGPQFADAHIQDVDNWSLDAELSIEPGRISGTSTTAIRTASYKNNQLPINTDDFYLVTFTIEEISQGSVRAVIWDENATYATTAFENTPGRHSTVMRVNVPSGGGNRNTVSVQFNAGTTAVVTGLECQQLTPILNQTEGMAAMSWIPHFGDEDVGLSTQTILLNTTTTGTSFLYFRKLSGAGVNRFQSFDGLNTAYVDISPELVANQLYLIVMRWTATAFQIGYKLNGAWAWGPEIAHQAWAEEDNLFLLPLASSNAPLNSNSKNVYLWLEDKGQAWLEKFFSGAAN